MTAGRAALLALVIALGCPLPALAQDGAPAAPTTAETRDRNLRAYMELLRSDLRTQKVAMITEIMQFTDDEDKAFWPVYREYDLGLSRLNDDRIRLIEQYAAVYDKLTDAAANDLIVNALDVEARLTALKQKYYEKLKGVMSPKTAARAIQVENQIQLLINLQIAAALPVAR